MKERILVTGGAGFIGSNFIRYMLDKYADLEIVNLDKLTYAGNPDNLKDVEEKYSDRYFFIKGDIINPEDVKKAIGEGVDGIINFAAETHVDRSLYNPLDFIKTDVEGTYVLLQAVKDLGIKRFHQISTDEVYGDVLEGFSAENDYLRPSSPYSASKAGGDFQILAACRTFNLPATITRATNNYGPFHYIEKIIPFFITNAIQDKELPIYDGGSQVRDWIYVTDHCSAIDLIFREGKIGEIYNVGANNDPEITNTQIADTILDLLEKPKSLKKDVRGLRPGHDQRYAVNCEKIKALGWKPQVQFDEGIKKTVEWYKNNQGWWKKIKSGEFLNYYKKHYKANL